MLGIQWIFSGWISKYLKCFLLWALWWSLSTVENWTPRITFHINSTEYSSGAYVYCLPLEIVLTAPWGHLSLSFWTHTLSLLHSFSLGRSISSEGSGLMWVRRQAENFTDVSSVEGVTLWAVVQRSHCSSSVACRVEYHARFWVQNCEITYCSPIDLGCQFFQSDVISQWEQGGELWREDRGFAQGWNPGELWTYALSARSRVSERVSEQDFIDVSTCFLEWMIASEDWVASDPTFLRLGHYLSHISFSACVCTSIWPQRSNALVLIGGKISHCGLCHDFCSLSLSLFFNDFHSFSATAHHFSLLSFFLIDGILIDSILKCMSIHQYNPQFHIIWSWQQLVFGTHMGLVYFSTL